MNSFIDNIFGKKNENYNKAVDGLKKMKDKFDGLIMSFPDVTPIEIVLLTDTWQKLPKEISKGVEVMILKTNMSECKAFITSYDPYSYVIPHKHDERYEYGLILEGTIINETIGCEYKKGDVYKFGPNEMHYLVSGPKKALVYSLHSKKSNLDDLLSPIQIDKALKSLNNLEILK
jgi:quercetin dioxygenase-like cupin family protein